MAAEITASSMGESIGLGYRTKDIGPQLMQFQAADLARKASEKSAAKKEKKADENKWMEKFFTVSSDKYHPSLQSEAKEEFATFRNKLSDNLYNDNPEGAMQVITDARDKANELKERSENYYKINDANNNPSLFVPEDLVKLVSGNKFIEPTGDQIEILKAQGTEYNPVTKTLIFKAHAKRSYVNELNAYKPSIEEMTVDGVNPEFQQSPTKAGFNKQGQYVYKPNDTTWNKYVNKVVSDPELVINAVNEISRSQQKTQTQLLMDTQKSMIDTGSNPLSLTKEEVMKQIVRNDLNNNKKQSWIDSHILTNELNPAPVGGGGGGNNNKDKNPANSADIQTFEGFSGSTRATIMKLVNEARKRDKDETILEGIENMTDAEITQIIQDDDGYIFGNEKQVLKNPKDQSYGVVISSTTENVDIPSLGKGGQTVALSSIRYDKKSGKFYATGKGTVTLAGGIVKAAQEIQFELTDQDLRSIKNKANTVKEIQAGLASYNANANTLAMPTIDAYLRGQKTVTLTKKQIDSGYAKEKAKNPSLKLDDYKKFLKDQGFTL
jgi:hypothetical protein